MNECQLPRLPIRQLLFAASLLLLTTASLAQAQTGCLKGTVLMAFGVNGAITVCPQYDGKVPGLQQQLTELQRTLSSNQDLLREIKHTVRSVNSVGQNVDPARQLELLQSFSQNLQHWITDGQEEAVHQIADLADKLDTLQDSITQTRDDVKTAGQTIAALNGKLGDAIAKLDLTKAQQQLDSIRAKLNQIGDDTQHIRETLDDQTKRQNEAAEAERKKAEDLDRDPNMYTRAQIMPSIAPLTGQLRMMIYFYSRPPLYPPFIDSTLSVAFRKGASEAWRIDATDKQVSAQGELWQLTLDNVGDRATFCFVAHDRQSGRLKEWKQRYRITQANSVVSPVNFVPEGDASMRLEDGEPCDAVTEVRKQVKETPPANPLGTRGATLSAADQLKQANDQVQAQLKAMHDQAGRTAPTAEMFAHIRVEGTRRDQTNGTQWQIKVSVQPSRLRATFYDEKLEANLIDQSGQVIPLQLSNRQLFVNIESRYAWANQIGAKAVVCFTAKDSELDKPYRMTAWFSIETTRVAWNQGGRQIPGETAAFVPAKPSALTEPGSGPCE